MNNLPEESYRREVSNETLLWLGQTLKDTETLVAYIGSGLTRQEIDTGFLSPARLHGRAIPVGFDEDGEEKKAFSVGYVKDEPAKFREGIDGRWC